jgi:hypothetical protein
MDSAQVNDGSNTSEPQCTLSKLELERSDGNAGRVDGSAQPHALSADAEVEVEVVSSAPECSADFCYEFSMHANTVCLC